MKIPEMIAQIDPNKRGFQAIRANMIFAIMLEGSGFAKVHQCGNSPDAFQVRLTGRGRRWLNGHEDMETTT